MTHKAIDIDIQNPTDIEGIEIFDNTVGHDPAKLSDISISDNDWTPEHAAKVLNKSVRTIRRMLQEGILRGYKIPGKRRDEWRVKPVNMTAIESVIVPLHNGQSAIVADNAQLWKLLQEKDAKIEALIMRTGYLQHQVESQKEEIKLLTYSQHKPSWWLRIKNLFLVEPKR
jgi:excisionase family DNA binding protein